ncbi:HesA/MoeB/ThiF family protein [Pseudoalteromonas denitrificans]|uniref:Molybdopterin-synthase adenylyltransferase n=1 Tax=Pseudoalteromonas denitrificans DSM 6059 TaxID=1123010 RepID=A0A1I1JZA2_9GAMM|nr:HesA/MoeB/ThiF family protein [Pseudoalteromonas denitrificans]SFC54027.1 adenylyltransferase and sulfurtransferase [Pseudoalteromonas denitrificans DSM 6059]
MSNTSLSEKEQLRYSRQLMLKEVGFDGQKKLKKAKVLIIGVGGLGCPAALYLAASGIGELTLVDADKVELTNLQRQILYKINYLGQAKTLAAKKSLASLNNEIKINTVNEKLTEINASALITNADIVLDCSDNFTTRYLVNRYCVRYQKILISAAAIATKGQLMVFDNRQEGEGCYQCIFEPSTHQESLNCETSGVYGPLLGVMGSMQAIQTLNYILGHMHLNQFISFDALTFEQQKISFSANPDCCICQ